MARRKKEQTTGSVSETNSGIENVNDVNENEEISKNIGAEKDEDPGNSADGGPKEAASEAGSGSGTASGREASGAEDGEPAAGENHSEDGRADGVFSVNTDEAGAEGMDSSEEEDDLVFVDESSVRDRSKMAEAPKTQGKGVSEKKTRRRAADKMDVRKDKLKRNMVFICVLIAAAIVVIAVLVINYRSRKAEEDAAPVISSSSEYEVSADSEIDELMAEYFSAYADDDVDALLNSAHPFTDNEKEYIQICSSYVESYENIVCYSAEAQAEGTYLTAVYFEKIYYDIDTAAPGILYFYIETNEAGELYIDNVYSEYNLTYGETEVDPQISTELAVFEAEEDIAALAAEVQADYEEAVASDEDLKEMVEVTLPAALADWEAELQEELAEDEESEAEEESEEEADAEEDASAEEETSEDEDASEDDSSAEDSSSSEDSSEAEESENEEEVTVTEDVAWVYVTDDVIIRKKPSTSSSALATATSGSEVRQLAVRSDGWTKIKTGDITGYIKTEYISDTAP